MGPDENPCSLRPGVQFPDSFLTSDFFFFFRNLKGLMIPQDNCFLYKRMSNTENDEKF